MRFLYINLKDETQVNYFYNNYLKDYLNTYQTDVPYTVSYWYEHIPYANPIKISQSIFLIVMQVFISFVILLITSSILSFSINSKTKQIGILKATGSHNKTIYSSFLILSTIIGLLGSILGIILSHFGLNIFQQLMTDEYGRLIFFVIKDFNIYLNAFLLTFILILISTLLALNKTRKIPTVELLK